MQNDKLSVIIPVYNTGNYLYKSIKSLINQRYKSLEIIIVDDGSTDNTWEIIEELKKYDDRIIAVRQKHKGVSVARNMGMSISEGKWVTFLDSDDYYDNSSLYNMIQYLEQTRAEIGIYAFLREYGSKVEADLLPWVDGTILDHEQICNELIPLMISIKRGSGSVSGSVCRSIFSKQLISNICFDPETSIQEDLLFCINSYSKASRILISNNNFYHYVKHKITTTEHYRKDFLYECILLEDKIIESLLNNGLEKIVDSRYAGKRVTMYSLCLSNLFRVDAPNDVDREIDEIIFEFKQDKYLKNKNVIDYIDFKRKIVFYMLKIGNRHLIRYLYRLKENKRRKRLL